jgi:hypothetical protein
LMMWLGAAPAPAESSCSITIPSAISSSGADACPSASSLPPLLP